MAADTRTTSLQQWWTDRDADTWLQMSATDMTCPSTAPPWHHGSQTPSSSSVTVWGSIARTPLNGRVYSTRGKGCVTIHRHGTTAHRRHHYQLQCEGVLQEHHSMVESTQLQNLLLLLLVWHAPLGVRSTKHRHQSPEWTILSHIDCFIQGEVIGFQVLLDSLHPRSTKASCWSHPVLPRCSC